MFTGRLRSEIPPALVRKSPSQKVQLYVFAVSKKLVFPPKYFIQIFQKSLGNALMTSGARLTQLDLSDNAFGPDGVKGIESLLKSSVCYTLRELRLNNCGMGIGGGMVSLGCNKLRDATF